MFYANHKEKSFSRGYLGIVIFSTMLLLGCSWQIPVASKPTNPVISPTPEPKNLGQTLPIEAKVKIGEQLIELEVARTAEQQAMGLMYRRHLAANRGMLFSFPLPRFAKFWMKNTLIPLDIIFLRNNKIVAIFNDVPPCKLDPCPSYGPDSKIEQVLELPAGRAAQLNLKPGDRLKIEFTRKTL